MGTTMINSRPGVIGEYPSFSVASRSKHQYSSICSELIGGFRPMWMQGIFKFQNSQGRVIEVVVPRFVFLEPVA